MEERALGIKMDLRFERNISLNIFMHYMKNMKYFDKDVMRQFYGRLTDCAAIGVQRNIIQVQNYIDLDQSDYIIKHIPAHAIVNIITYCTYCNMYEYKHLNSKESILKFEKLLSLYEVNNAN